MYSFLNMARFSLGQSFFAFFFAFFLLWYKSLLTFSMEKPSMSVHSLSPQYKIEKFASLTRVKNRQLW